MNRFVLDTSVAVAWYLPERFSSEARSWQTQLLEGKVELVVPTLHFWEFGNVLHTYVRRAEIDEDLAREIYALHLESALSVLEPDRSLVLVTALEFDATTYDAVYIALSRELELPLITAERTTTQWVSRMRDKVIVVARD